MSPQNAVPWQTLAKKDGGDDGTRTRGLCLDGVALLCNGLILNGVGGHLLIPRGTACHPLIVPT